VPRAFASAVAACRFEQGDVFYDDPCAYRDGAGSWGEVVAELSYAIQVLDPPRSARNVPSDAGGRRFDANWNAPVSLELWDFTAGSAMTTQHSTQGRLFSCLWQANPGLLLASPEAAVASPEPPGTGRDLHAALAEALPGVRRARPRTGNDEGLLYVFVLDEASESSLSKMRAVASILEGRLTAVPTSLAPGEVLPSAAPFHPALRICACSIATSDESAVRDLLKSVLYAPTREAEATEPGDSDRSADRFRLERHGLLVNTAAPPEA
jgi:hypothetical protein